MLSREENILLTHIGPGAPGGDLLRRYWQPVALSEELPPGGAPLPVRLLGEDLVLFRVEHDRIGLLDRHCSHRGADLTYGRLEDGGLRCAYHGWLYDTHGRCLEQPGEPPDSNFREKIRHPAYPCQEFGGVIFAFLGPGDPPLLPAYKALTAPEEHRYLTKVFQECNYLQANEGNIDPIHTSFLHRQDISQDFAFKQFSLGHVTDFEIEETDYGVRIFVVRDVEAETNLVRITNFVMPNLCAIAGPTGGHGYSIHWHVPIDDEHHWRYEIVYSTKPIDRVGLTRMYHAEMDEQRRLTRNKANRYMQDREEMKGRTYLGMGPWFQVHDAFATEGQGPIQDRTREHLGTTDKVIIAERRLLLQAIHDVQAGRDPRHVIRDSAANDMSHIVVAADMVPKSVDWKNYWKAELNPSLA